MSWTRFWGIVCALGLTLGAAGTARATVFFTEGFNYSDGDLTTVASPTWRTHSGTAGTLDVAGGKVAAVQGGSGLTEDANRDTGSTLAYGGSTWYYGAKFTVTDTRPTPGTGTINPVYFLHFKEMADSVGGELMFRSRLYVQSGTDPANFTLGLSSGTVASDGTNGQRVSWGSDLTFGTEYTIIASYTSDDDDTNVALTSDGFASLWVNPINSMSTSITDNLPNTNITNDLLRPQTQLAIRQGTSGGANGPARADVDIVSIGDSFAEVLAALAPPPANNSDFDNDGDVDGADFAIWQQGLGLTGQPNKSTGDADGDGDVDGTDLGIWQAHYGSSPAVGAAAAVPEPASFLLVASALVGLAARRRIA